LILCTRLFKKNVTKFVLWNIDPIEPGLKQQCLGSLILMLMLIPTVFCIPRVPLSSWIIIAKPHHTIIVRTHINLQRGKSVRDADWNWGSDCPISKLKYYAFPFRINALSLCSLVFHYGVLRLRNTRRTGYRGIGFNRKTLQLCSTGGLTYRN
jgi:hypothetical protein